MRPRPNDAYILETTAACLGAWTVNSSVRFTSADLECLPDVDGVRYEIIDGDLYVSKTPDARHQYACLEIGSALSQWNRQTGAGVAFVAPGLVFASDEDVVPDVAWVSRDRLLLIMDDRGHFRAAPDLVVEVLSPGAENARRDRELKLKLYSRQGVREYWIVDWRLRTVEVYRRSDEVLQLVGTLTDLDLLTSPLLPGFRCPLANLWDIAS